MNSLSETVSAALSRTDPEGLIAMGAPPESEYDFEGRLIAEQLSAHVKLTESMIIDVFEYAFKKNISNTEPYKKAYIEIRKSLENYEENI